jgi:hypothetical protein
VRTRIYTIYGMSRIGLFSTYTAAYGRGTHPWVIEVRAVSVKQAYGLAARQVWARDSRSLGVQRVSHGGTEERAPYCAEATA